MTYKDKHLYIHTYAHLFYALMLLHPNSCTYTNEVVAKIRHSLVISLIH